jgi:hypothetical protein
VDSGVAPASIVSQLINPVPFPRVLDDVWIWFNELSHTGRVYGPEGVAQPLSSTEILAWSTLHHLQLAPWELRLIRLLDVAWLNEQR